MSKSMEYSDALAPTFSIITATFNSGVLLDRTIASLRSQSFQDYQWIVVDGASTDDTLPRVKLAQDINTELISEPDEGISDAWNKGLARATGDYVLMLNAGDCYDSSFLGVVAQHCDGVRIICSHARILSEDGNRVGVFRAEPRKLNRGMHLPHNWCAVPRRQYQALGFYPMIPLAMDFAWFHGYYKKFGVDGFRVVDQVLGDYYLGGKSDQDYAASFGYNEQILVENGTSVIVARAYRIFCGLKHAIKYRVLR